MPAYLHATGTVTDPVLYDEYRRQVPALIAAHGGRYLVRGGATERLEGDAVEGLRHVIVEFPDMAHLKAFYEDPAYAPLIALRQRASTLALLALEGV